MFIPGYKPKLQKRERNRMPNVNTQSKNVEHDKSESVEKINTQKENRHIENEMVNNSKDKLNTQRNSQIQQLILQNNQLLKESKRQGEIIRQEFNKVNESIENLNVLVGQLFAQMNLIDKNLLSLLADKTISTREKLQYVNQNALVINQNLTEDEEEISLENQNVIGEEAKQQNCVKKEKDLTQKSSAEKTQNLKKKNLIKKRISPSKMPLPESPKVEEENEMMDIEITKQRKRALTGTPSPMMTKKVKIPTQSNFMSDHTVLKEKRKI